MANGWRVPCRRRCGFGRITRRGTCGCWPGGRGMPIRPGACWRWRRSMMAASRGEAAQIGGVHAADGAGLGGGVQRPGPGRPDRRQGAGQRPRLNRRAARGPDGGSSRAARSRRSHGVVRWRLIDLAQWVFDEFRIAISKQTLSRMCAPWAIASSRPGRAIMPRTPPRRRLSKKLRRPPGGDRRRRSRQASR